MENKRQIKIRRQSDRVLQKTVEILQILEKRAKGEDVDFTEAYAELVGMKDQLGRRKEDHRLGETLCITIEGLADTMSRPVPSKAESREDSHRKVRLTKMSGDKSQGKAIVGWEDKAPLVGQGYRVFREDGGIILTSVVIKVASGEIRTRNSVYQIEVLEE